MTLEGISSYTEEANLQCRALASFFRRRQEIELEYGTQMANLCMEYKRAAWGDMTPENREIYSNSVNKLGIRSNLLGLSHWRGVFEAVTMCSGVAETHVQFAGSLQREIIDPLQGQIREMESMRKAHMDLGKHLSRQLQDAYTEFKVAKEEHDVSVAAKSEIADQLSKAQLSNNTKKKEIDKLIIKSNQANERYEEAVRKLKESEVHRNEAQSDYFGARVPALHMDICNYEEKRMDILKGVLTEVFHLEQMSYSTRAVWTKATDDLITSMDIGMDISYFKDMYCSDDDRDVTMVSVRSLINPVKAGRVQLKRGDSNPDWVGQYFVLMEDNGGLLYIFEQEDSEKPTEVIKLGICSIWSVDDSFFGIANCLQLIIDDGVDMRSTYNFVVENTFAKQEWLIGLRKLCTGCDKCQELLRSPGIDNEPRSMKLWLVEAKDLPAKSNPFCVVLLNDVKQARTQVRSGESPFWGEEFSFNDIPPCRSRLRLLFFSHQQGKTRDQELGYVSINLTNVLPGKKVEEWGQITSFTPEKTIVGSVRIAYLLSNNATLPLEGYDQFISIITMPELEAVRFIGNYIGNQKEDFAKVVLNMMIAQGRDVSAVKVLVKHEILETEDANIIFRGNSVATKMLDYYMKVLGTTFLRDTIGSLLKGVYQSKDSCEIDPLRLSKNDDAKKNFKRLSNHVSLFWEVIQSSISQTPLELRDIFKSIGTECDEKFHDDKARYAAVSGFVFLRFFCPAILNPKLFGIMPDHPDQSTSRTLTLIAKIIQNLANLSEFEGKEPHMQIFNEWILTHKPQMTHYIDTLCNVSPEDLTLTPRPVVNVRTEAAALHSLIKSKWDVLASAMDQGPPSVTELKPVIENLDSIVSSKNTSRGEQSDRIKFDMLGAPQLPPLDLFRDAVSKRMSILPKTHSDLASVRQKFSTTDSGSPSFASHELEDDFSYPSTASFMKMESEPKRKGWRDSLLRKPSANSNMTTESPDTTTSSFMISPLENSSQFGSSTSLANAESPRTPRTAAKFTTLRRIKGLLSKTDSTVSANTSQTNLPIV